MFAGWWQLISELGAVPRVLVWDGEGAIGQLTTSRMQSLRASRLCPLGNRIAAGLLISWVVAVTGGAASPAAADAVAPSWWLGATCDAAYNPGSHALGASYDGVVACGPGTAQGGTDLEEYFFQGAWGEYE